MGIIMGKRVRLLVILPIIYFIILFIGFLVYFAIDPREHITQTQAKLGLLSWSASIYAPIVGFLLLNNWRNQTAYNEQIKCLAAMRINLHKVRKEVSNIRKSRINHSYLTKLITKLDKSDNKKEQSNLDSEAPSSEFEIPDFSEMYDNIEEMKYLAEQFFLFSNREIRGSNYKDSGYSSLILLKFYIEELHTFLVFFRDRISQNKISNLSNESRAEIFNKALYCNALLLDDYQHKESKMTNSYIAKLEAQFFYVDEKIKKYRKAID